MAVKLTAQYQLDRNHSETHAYATGRVRVINDTGIHDGFAGYDPDVTVQQQNLTLLDDVGSWAAGTHNPATNVQLGWRDVNGAIPRDAEAVFNGGWRYDIGAQRAGPGVQKIEFGIFENDPNPLDQNGMYLLLIDTDNNGDGTHDLDHTFVILPEENFYRIQCTWLNEQAFVLGQLIDSLIVTPGLPCVQQGAYRVTPPGGADRVRLDLIDPVGRTFFGNVKVLE